MCLLYLPVEETCRPNWFYCQPLVSNLKAFLCSHAVVSDKWLPACCFIHMCHQGPKQSRWLASELTMSNRNSNHWPSTLQASDIPLNKNMFIVNFEPNSPLNDIYVLIREPMFCPQVFPVPGLLQSGAD